MHNFSGENFRSKEVLFVTLMKDFDLVDVKKSANLYVVFYNTSRHFRPVTNRKQIQTPQAVLCSREEISETQQVLPTVFKWSEKLHGFEKKIEAFLNFSRESSLVFFGYH